MRYAHLLETDGFVALRDHPDLRRSVESAARRGRLARVLPGVWTSDPAGLALEQRVRAVCGWDPDAVVLGDAALHLLVDQQHPAEEVLVATPSRHRDQPGFRFSRRRVPPELVSHRTGARFARPALLAVDLARTDDGSAIDLVLRKRAATLAGMREALRVCARWPGNVHRAEVLLDSRDEPWSRAERLLHRCLRAAGLGGWRSNVRLEVEGCTYYGDVVFDQQRVVLEVDGFAVHSTRVAFEHDRRRQNQLQLGGWWVLRVTWAMIQDEPEVVVEWVRQALAARAHGC
jgi:very-short-patch-repair endonuclease